MLQFSSSNVNFKVVVRINTNHRAGVLQFVSKKNVQYLNELSSFINQLRDTISKFQKRNRTH